MADSMTVWTSDAAWTIYGVIVGAVLALGIDVLRQRIYRRSRGADLARRTVVRLDAYIEELVGWEDRRGHEYISEAKLPAALALPDGVDWAAIDKQLAYDLLKLPADHDAARRSSEFLWEVADEDAVYRELGRSVSKLAREADRCALRLRETYGLPKRDVSEWDPMSRFKSDRAA